MLMSVAELTAGYGKKEVLHGVNMHINEGEIITLLGHNGAGKSTLLRAVFGLVDPRGGKVVLNGEDITALKSSVKVRKGVSIVLDGKAVFPSLTVAENLELGAYSLTGAEKSEIPKRMDEIYQLFPRLGERQNQKAGLMSGGEQKMMSIAISLMTKPKLLMLDEPSVGLAPVLVEKVLEAIQNINRELGMAIILVEQSIQGALGIAQRAYVMKMGKIILEEGAAELSVRENLWDFF